MTTRAMQHFSFRCLREMARERSVLLLLTRSGDGASDDIRITLLEQLLEEPTAGPMTAERAALIALYLNLLLEDGLTDHARAFFDSLLAADLKAFWAAYAALDFEAYRRTRESNEGELVLNLTAAYTVAGREADARALLARSSALLRSDADDPNYDHALAGLLAEALEPRIERHALYDYMIVGRALDEAAIADLAEERRPSALGWLWAARSSTPAARTIAHRLVTIAGYPEMADYLEDRDDLRFHRYEATLENETTAELRAALGAALGPQFAARNAEVRESIRSALGRDNPPRHELSSATVGERAPPVVAPFGLVEKPVPSAYRRKPGVAAVASELPAGVALPVEPYQAARVARGEGDDWYVVYASHALDPVGEVSRGGYWLARSQDGGKTWAAAWYLGLQEYFPYVVAPDSLLPIAASREDPVGSPCSRARYAFDHVPAGIARHEG